MTAVANAKNQISVELVEAFFEEAREGLETLESGLLELSEGAQEGERVHTIFRAAHSIKGAAGAFGFSDITNFTHHRARRKAATGSTSSRIATCCAPETSRVTSCESWRDSARSPPRAA